MKSISAPPRWLPDGVSGHVACSRPGWAEQRVGESQAFARGIIEHERPSTGSAVEELDVVLLGEPVAAVEVQGSVSGVAGAVGVEHERH